MLEASSFLALLIATVMKYRADQPIGVEILGPIHGLLFVAYVVVALSIREEQRWNLLKTFAVLLGAVMPFGGFVVDRWIGKASIDQQVTAEG